MRSAADAVGLCLVLCGFAVFLIGLYDWARFYRLWRQEMLAKTPNASELSLAQAWRYAPFLDNVSAECNALRRRANQWVVIFIALWAVVLIFMFAIHSYGIYPAKPLS